MIKAPLIASAIAGGLVLPAGGGLYIPPRPAIVKAENLDMSKHMLLGMPLTMGMVAKSAGGAAPTIAATKTSGGSSLNSTSHDVEYPTGIVSGNLLVAIIAVSGGSTLTMPAGWTAAVGVTGAGGFTGRLNVSYRIADGSESGVFTVTTASSTGTCAIVYRVTGNRSGTVVNTDLATFGSTLSSTSTPNPPAVTPTWGSSNNLWIQSLCWQSRSTDRTADPSGYTLGSATSDSSVGANQIASAAVGVQKEASSEDPGAWTLSASALTVWITIVLRAP